MTNKEIAKVFSELASIMELHDENPFKIRAIEGTASALDALSFPVAEVERSGLPDRTGLSKTAAAKVAELLDTGTFSDLQRLLDVTPPGVVEMLGIKGIGPKKIRLTFSFPITRASSCIVQYITINPNSMIWTAQKCGHTISASNFSLPATRPPACRAKSTSRSR